MVISLPIATAVAVVLWCAGFILSGFVNNGVEELVVAMAFLVGLTFGIPTLVVLVVSANIALVWGQGSASNLALFLLTVAVLSTMSFYVFYGRDNPSFIPDAIEWLWVPTVLAVVAFLPAMVRRTR